MTSNPPFIPKSEYTCKSCKYAQRPEDAEANDPYLCYAFPPIVKGFLFPQGLAPIQFRPTVAPSDFCSIFYPREIN